MKKLEKVFDIIGEILAVLLVVVYIVAMANAISGLLDLVTVHEKILKIVIHN